MIRSLHEYYRICGGRGIRTPDDLTTIRAFQARALGHYAIPPSEHIVPDSLFAINLDNDQRIDHTKEEAMRFFAARLWSFLLCLAILFVSLPASAFAQTNPAHNLNTEQGVARNQHTYLQTTTIELSAALICQLIGIDVLNPNQGCIGFNTQTGKLGYAPVARDEHGNVHIGGALGFMTQTMAYMYIPTVSTQAYVNDLKNNFGIVKPVYAQTSFQALEPIQGLWRQMLNVSYSLLILAFMFIGLGIMLRFKIDPRTVMTLQNQIPKVIICIILITFSYAIAAVMTELTWATTYAGINLIAESRVDVQGNAQEIENDIGAKATTNILDTPLGFANTIMNPCDEAGDSCGRNGVFNLAWHTSRAIGNLLEEMFRDTFGIGTAESDRFKDWGDYLNPLNYVGAVADAAGQAFVFVLNYIIGILVLLIIVIAIVVSMFRVWWALLQCYV